MKLFNTNSKKASFPAILIVRSDDEIRICGEVASMDEANALAKEYVDWAHPENEESIQPNDFEIHSRDKNGRYTKIYTYNLE